MIEMKVTGARRESLARIRVRVTVRVKVRVRVRVCPSPNPNPDQMAAMLVQPLRPAPSTPSWKPISPR